MTFISQVSPIQRLFAVALLSIAIFAAFRFPVHPAWLGVGLALYALILWRWPAAWLVAVPALLPVLDMTLWTGRFFFNEFDIVILFTVAVAWWRFPLATGPKVFFPEAGIVVAILAVVHLLSTAIGLFPLPPLDANAFTNYYSPFNSLRVSKGFWWALLLLSLLRQEIRRGTPVSRLFAMGMLIGLAATTLVIVWERHIFPGLFNFDSDYRVSAMFSGMHTGGASVDAYLAAALPFAMACFLLWRGRAVRLAGIGIFAAALYSLLVTFSRIDYLAFAASGLVLFCGALFLFKRFRGIGRIVTAGVILLLITLFIAVPVLKGSYMQQRFSTNAESLQTRLGHWRMTLSMRNADRMTTLFGMGQGSFPRTYFQRNDEHVAPGTYQLSSEDGIRSLRLVGGESLYMGQRICLPANNFYALCLELRSNVKGGTLEVPICEKAVMYSFNGRWTSIEMGAAPGEWKQYQVIVDLGNLGRGRWYSRRPMELALCAAQKGLVVDVRNVRLIAPDGRNLIRNGDFSAGLDHWFFSNDNHLLWHSKNLCVQVLFEQGWVGLVVFVALSGYVFFILGKRIGTGDGFALLSMASLVGFLCVGLADSLFDEPRMALLFFLVVWLAMAHPPLPGREGKAASPPSPSLLPLPQHT